MRGIVRNVDRSRGDDIAGAADFDTPPYPISVFALVFLVGAGFVKASVFLRFCRFGIFWELLVVFSGIFQSTPVSTRAGCRVPILLGMWLG